MRAPRWPLHELPLRRGRLLAGAAVIAVLVGGALDALVPMSADRFFHDTATGLSPRRTWQHTAIVALDEDVPIDVEKISMLPLYARAAEVAVAAGARAVYLDASIVAYPHQRIPYARCIDHRRQPAEVCWLGKDCQSDPEATVATPMELSPSVASRFLLLTPILPGGLQPAGADVCFDGAGERPRWPLQLLVGAAANRTLNRERRVVCSELPEPARQAADGVVRWIPRAPHHAALALAAAFAPERAARLMEPHPGDEPCTLAGRLTTCPRLRLGLPIAGFSASQDRPIVKLSSLADCDPQVAAAAAALLKDRVVILQAAGFEEHADLHVSAMTVGALGPHQFTPGPQLLADGVETLLADDAPRRAPFAARALLLLLAAILGVLGGAYLRASATPFVPLLVGGAAFFAAFVTPPVLHLMPITAALVSCLVGLAAMITSHMVLGTQQGRITARYLPRPVQSMLLAVGGAARFEHRACQATVLMSDLKGYSTVTSLLKTASAIFTLLNDYLEHTTQTLQDGHGGWLEGYVGDMVCFYWPDVEEGATAERAMERALRGALELSSLQDRYFESLGERTLPGVDVQALRAATRILGAGIGIASGTVIMGNQGPTDGVQKFGILGDPLNLSSRLEGLTRHFTTHIITSVEVAEVARRLGLGVRRLARVKVKGRLDPSDIFAVGAADDPRFEKAVIAAWEAWLARAEHGDLAGAAPDLFEKDAATLASWRDKKLLDAAAGCFTLDEK